MGGLDPENENQEEKPFINEQDITRDFLTSDQSFVFSDEV